MNTYYKAPLLSRARLTGLALALLAVSVVVAMFLSVHQVGAQQGQDGKESIVLSPATKRYSFKAGQTTTDSIKVLNDGNVAYDFTVYARPYSVANEKYDADFMTTRENADVYRWVQFAKTSYHLEPGGQVDIPYTVRVPNDAAPGGHYGVLFVETQPKSPEGNSVARKKRLGSIMYAAVEGEIIKNASLQRISIPFWQSRPPLSSTVLVKNDGNVDYTANVTFRVKDVFNRQKYGDTKDYVVLPKTSREIQAQWENAPWFGLFKAEVSTSFLDQKQTKSGYVLIAPKWLLIVLGVVLVGGAVYGVFRLRRR